MENLGALKCEVCKVGVLPVTEAQIGEFKLKIPEWNIIEENNIKKLVREFRFNNFKETLVLVNEIGKLAEEQEHHPKMFVEYNRLTVWWWTHKIKGLHRNDFIMAAKTDNIIK